MRHLSLAVVAIFFLVSCGDKDKKAPDPEDMGVPELNGTWQSNCLQNSTAYSGPLGEKRVVTVDGSKVTTQHVLFRDENCSGAQMQLTIVKHSNVHFSDVSKDTNSAGFFTVDDVVTGYGLVPANPDYADLLSRSQYCKYKKWKAGVEYSVMNRSCAEKIMFPKMTFYTILKYDENSQPNTFVLGRYSASENGSTPQSRPKSLGGDIHFRIGQ
jgi:hypothetical protein